MADMSTGVRGPVWSQAHLLIYRLRKLFSGCISPWLLHLLTPSGRTNPIGHPCSAFVPLLETFLPDPDLCYQDVTKKLPRCYPIANLIQTCVGAGRLDPLAPLGSRSAPGSCCSGRLRGPSCPFENHLPTPLIVFTEAAVESV